jgi:glyoxylase-like metal-dependent hydrolase (beta-lactamase superfamily II)
MAEQKSLPTSPHFRLQQLAAGVFAAISRDGGAAIANAGIVDLGERTLIFDTFLTPQAARDLHAAAAALTGRAPALVVNSHFHNDHIWGNQVFAPAAQIVASEATRALITTAGQEEYAWYSAHSAAQLQKLQEEAAQATSAAAKQQVALGIAYYEALVQALPALDICLPTVTFDERCFFYGRTRRAELHAFAAGHTGNDTVLYLPDDGILFMSDLLFVAFHPYLPEGDPDNLVKTLDTLLTWQAGVLVPGHGPVGRREDAETLVAYIRACMALAQELVASGRADEVASVEVPAPYVSWQYPQFFQANLRFLVQRQGA